MFDLARITRPDVDPINELCNDQMPTDVSMDITKLKGKLKL